MQYLTELMNIINSCRKAVGLWGSYMKGQRQVHLDSLTDHLGPLLNWARSDRVQAEVNGVLLATHAKARFYEVLKSKVPAAAISTWSSLPSVVAGSPQWAHPCSAAADCAMTALHMQL